MPPATRIARAIAHQMNPKSSPIVLTINRFAGCFFICARRPAHSISLQTSDNTACIWDAATAKEIAVLRHENTVTSAAFSPDGAPIVTASEDHTAADSQENVIPFETIPHLTEPLSVLPQFFLNR
jgi:WD40 repeat protein